MTMITPMIMMEQRPERRTVQALQVRPTVLMGLVQQTKTEVQMVPELQTELVQLMEAPAQQVQPATLAVLAQPMVRVLRVLPDQRDPQELPCKSPMIKR